MVDYANEQQSSYLGNYGGGHQSLGRHAKASSTTKVKEIVDEGYETREARS